MNKKVVENGNKKRKWPYVILLLILLLAGTGFYFFHKYLSADRWQPGLKKTVASAVLKSSNGLYHIKYSSINVDILAGNVNLSDFELYPDTAVYNKLVTQNKAPDNLFIVSVKKLAIKDAGAIKAYQDKKLDINDITIDKPKITIINKRYGYSAGTKTDRSQSLYELIKNTFKEVKIGLVYVNDVSVKYIDKNQQTVKSTMFNHVTINIANILIDSLSGRDTTRFYYTKGLEVTLKGYGFKTPDNLYQATLGKLTFSAEKKQIVIDKAALVPRYKPNDFYRKTGEGDNIYTLRFSKIAINDINLQSLLTGRQLLATSMDVSDSYVGIYDNDAIVSKPTSQIGKDPQQLLQKLAPKIHFKRICFNNANVVYSEADKESGLTGQVLFMNTNGYLLNVTNDAAAKAINPSLSAHFDTRFMNEAPLSVNFKFNSNSASGAFNYSGQLGKYDGRKLDKLVKPLAMVHVVSADIDRLTFNINASNYSSKGNVDFYYRNLKIQLLKKVKGNAVLQKKGLITMLANDFILKDNNPSNKGVFRPGSFTLERKPTDSFFTFLYKSVLEGLKPAVGLSVENRNNVTKAIFKITGLARKSQTSTVADNNKAAQN